MEKENFVSFGEEAAGEVAQLTYGSYLRLPQLLDAQHLESDPPAHDELLFITIHQVYELWFQQLLHEVEAVRDTMLGAAGTREDGDQLWRARHLMNRVHVIARVLVQQVDVLEGYVDRFRGLTATERDHLRRRLAEPSLWDAFLALLTARGLEVSSDEQITDSLRTIAYDRSTHGDLWAMAEALILHDELAAAWRARHVVMVERMIGSRTGTGGSTGSAYLRSRLELKYYPLLWDLRSAL